MSSDDWIPDEGIHKGLITDIAAPEQTQSDENRFVVRIGVLFGDRVGTVYMVGFLQPMYMIYKSRSFWISQTVDVRVEHKVVEGKKFYSATVLFA